MATIKPRRVATDPQAWGEDELLSFSEAAALLWPDGPLTASIPPASPEIEEE